MISIMLAFTADVVVRVHGKLICARANRKMWLTSLKASGNAAENERSKLMSVSRVNFVALGFSFEAHYTPEAGSWC